MKLFQKSLPVPGLNEIFQPAGYTIDPNKISEHVQFVFNWCDPTIWLNSPNSGMGGINFRLVDGANASTTVDIAGGGGPPGGFYEQVLSVAVFHDDPAARNLFLHLRGTDSLTGTAFNIPLASSLDTPVAARPAGVNNALIWQPGHKVLLTPASGLFLRGEASAMAAGQHLTIVRFTLVLRTGQVSL